MQIGKGSFGRVYLATMNSDCLGRNCKDNKYYAIKTLEKKKILQKNETTHINCERKVLIDNLKHPFLVSLKYSFQTVDKLYFVLDYVNGHKGWKKFENLGFFGLLNDFLNGKLHISLKFRHYF